MPVDPAGVVAAGVPARRAAGDHHADRPALVDDVHHHDHGPAAVEQQHDPDVVIDLDDRRRCRPVNGSTSTSPPPVRGR